MQAFQPKLNYRHLIITVKRGLGFALSVTYFKLLYLYYKYWGKAQSISPRRRLVQSQVAKRKTLKASGSNQLRKAFVRRYAKACRPRPLQLYWLITCLSAADQIDSDQDRSVIARMIIAKVHRRHQFWSGIVLLALFQYARSTRSIKLAFQILNEFEEVDELMLVLVRRFLAVPELAEIAAVTLIKFDSDWQESLMTACLQSTAKAHRSLLVNAAYIACESNQQLSGTMKKLLDELLAGEVAFDLLDGSMAQSILERRLYALDCSPFYRNSVAASALKLAFAVTPGELAITAQLMENSKNYLQDLLNPTMQDRLGHLFCVFRIKLYLERHHQDHERQHKVIPLHGDRQFQPNRADLSEFAAERREIEQLCSEVIASQKWAYMVAANLKLHDNLEETIVAADLLGLSIFHELMRLVRSDSDNIVLWNQLAKYRDPWMEWKYFEYYQELLRNDGLASHDRASQIASILLLKKSQCIDTELRQLIRRYKLTVCNS